MPAEIALQLYTLREFLKTPADIAATLRRVRQMGYRAVQISGLGAIDARELKRILDGEGLTCCVTHVGLDRLKGETQKVIEEHQLWGCKWTAVGGFFKPGGNATAAEWAAFATEYSALAEKFAVAGIGLGYHNHSHEWIRTDSGQIPMEILLEKCSAGVWFEIDTYWVQHGGGDPAAWIRRVGGRIPVAHFKDMRVVRNADGHVVPQMAEVGEGNLNWPGILAACEESGVAWYAIEQDICQRDPFESVEMSLRNLRRMMG